MSLGQAIAGAMLNVGVTGHRALRLPAGAARALPTRLSAVFAALDDAAHTVVDAQPGVAAAASTHRMLLHTPLATGADQIATFAAAALGIRIHALLPFAAADYATDFAPGAERADFMRMLARADTVTALPGDRADGPGAYVALGEAVIEVADVIVAVWDGNTAVAPGGTAHVVALALAAGVPVIHVRVGEGSADATPVLLVGDAGVAGLPMESAADYGKLVRSVLSPRIAGRS